MNFKFKILNLKRGFPQPHFLDLKSGAGFTIIEALVALVVLTLALIPALFLSGSTVNLASSIRNNLIAANLGQEGAEVIRAIRDSNWFTGQSFDTSLADGTYRVEWNSDSLIPLSSNPPLKLDNGLYNYSTGNDTIFKRAVTITKVSDSELRIVSEITWKDRGNRDKSIQIESHLFNWK